MLYVTMPQKGYIVVRGAGGSSIVIVFLWSSSFFGWFWLG